MFWAQSLSEQFYSYILACLLKCQFPQSRPTTHWNKHARHQAYIVTWWCTSTLQAITWQDTCAQVFSGMHNAVYLYTNRKLRYPGNCQGCLWPCVTNFVFSTICYQKDSRGPGCPYLHIHTALRPKILEYNYTINCSPKSSIVPDLCAVARSAPGTW